MKIIITAQEALDKGVWLELCQLKGLNEYALADNLIDSSHEIELTEYEAYKLRIRL